MLGSKTRALSTLETYSTSSEQHPQSHIQLFMPHPCFLSCMIQLISRPRAGLGTSRLCSHNTLHLLSPVFPVVQKEMCLLIYLHYKTFCFLRARNQPSLIFYSRDAALPKQYKVCVWWEFESKHSLILFSEQWRGAKCLRIQGVLIKTVFLLFVLIPRASFNNASLRFRCSVKVTHICSASP